MEWQVGFSRKAAKKLKTLPDNILLRLARLAEEIRIEIKGRKIRRFTVPKAKVGKLIKLIENYENKPSGNDEWIPAQEVFKDIFKKHGKPGAILKGSRLKENLTQVALAKELGIPQQHISAIEGGKRPIGKEMAKRFAKVFHTDYRIFL